MMETVTTTSSSSGEIMLSIGGLQNKTWAEDTSKFGFKMLEKMGWKAGQGLGKELQGRASHVKIKKRSENLGLGCSLKEAEVSGWSHTSKGFAEILSELNSSYSSSSKPEERSDRKAAKKAAKKAKKKSKLNKIVYQKRLKNKNAKGYSASDMAAILGHAAKSHPAFSPPAAITSCDKPKKKKKKKSKI